MAVQRVLRIADLRDNVFLTMPEILEALPAQAASLQWRVLDLGEVVAEDESGLNVLDLEEQVFASPTGLPLSFAELCGLAKSTRQVIDGLFVAIQPGAEPPERTDADASILDRSHALVAAFDSTFWLVGAPDTWLDQIRQAFDDVHEADPYRTPLRVWGPTPT